MSYSELFLGGDGNDQANRGFHLVEIGDGLQLVILPNVVFDFVIHDSHPPVGIMENKRPDWFQTKHVSSRADVKNTRSEHSSPFLLFNRIYGKKCRPIFTDTSLLSERL